MNKMQIGHVLLHLTRHSILDFLFYLQLLTFEYDAELFNVHTKTTKIEFSIRIQSTMANAIDKYVQIRKS